MNSRCNVQCYGQGDVHDKIVKKLKITRCADPGVPCVLFVYNVSREAEDLQNALQWVKGKQGVSREDVCAVILLEKSLAKESKPEDVAHQGMFDDKTVVVRILWKRKNSASKIRKGPRSNSNAMRKIRASIEKRQGSGKDPQGGDIPSMMNKSSPSNNTTSSKKVQCNVQCCGQGDVHDKIVKRLKITRCADPGVPCVLFVYNVSREVEDLQNALQWVKEKQGVSREDVCAVILLEKSLAKESKPEDVAHQGMFDEITVVVRILWKRKNSASKIRKGPRSNSNAMRKIRASIEKRQESARVSDGLKLL
ncbi:uncharacterized protein LOC132393901 isoform X2 [Hypanus sabinus]|uniref:uncharacterized protein LOC132393901 isoform X2 n=1 Tax=Hypanus sabinus TaxID=79690 RepID=UPI0028C48694|nr:uncharacterized protein LOC132393901 isoform X2 [Hypanus sabinus]